jgi:hypothetical protein
MILRITTRSILFLVFFCAITAHAQRFENVRTSFSGGTVIILYDITGSKQDQKFNVEIFGSHNSYISPLKNVLGDVGPNVSGGLNRQVQWNAAAELGTFNGDVTFRLRGELIVVPYSFVAPAEGGSVRRGKEAQIKWNGGAAGQQVKLDVIQNGSVVNTIAAGTSNTGEFVWQVPSDMQKGAYNVRLTAGTQTIQSGTFKVKAKIPLLLKVSPLIVAGIIIIVLPKDKPTTPGTGSEDSDLPDAPGPK